MFSDINLAIRTFVHQYESRHRVTVLDYDLGKATTIETGSYFSCGIFQLNFTFQDADQHAVFFSSVFFKIPRLGVLVKHGQRMSIYAREIYVYKRILPLMYKSWSRER